MVLSIVYRKSIINNLTIVLGFTWHESENMRDIFLIKKDIHKIVSHRGGRANVKYLSKLLNGGKNV